VVQPPTSSPSASEKCSVDLPMHVFLECCYKPLRNAVVVWSKSSNMPDLLVATMVVSVFGNPPQNGSEIAFLGCRIFIYV